jgi:tRNA threonylcarbamoyladenosine modification (KEOPS) complex  Pcc1 subunit
MSSDGEGHRLFLGIDDETTRKAVAPEAGEIDDENARIYDEGVTVRTDDLRELRAAVNGWTRLVSVASDGRL